MPFGGNSATVLKYAKEAARICQEVVIFQSYRFASPEELPLNQLSEIPNAKVVTLKGRWYKLVDLTRGMPYGFLLHYLIFPFFVLYRCLVNGPIIKKEGKFDGIYCFDFVDTGIFGDATKVIALGTHNQKMGYLKTQAANVTLFLLVCSRFGGKAVSLCNRRVRSVFLERSLRRFDGAFTVSRSARDMSALFVPPTRIRSS